MSFLTDKNQDLDLHDQISSLRKEVAVLGRRLARQGADTARQTRDGTSELYGEIVDALTAALPAVAAPARRMQRAVRDNPDRAVAITGLAALAVAAAFIWSRRR